MSVKSSNYNVLSDPQKKYNVGVNYEIPSKYLQYGNEILDTTNWVFDGTTSDYPLIDQAGDAYTPVNDQQLIVAINGLVQVPGIDYTISGTTIIFNTAPTAGDTVYVVGLSTTADLTRTINFVIDSGSAPMSSGIKGEMTLDVTGEIQSWTIVGDQDGQIQLDIGKVDYANFPNFASICGTERPQLGDIASNSVQRKNTNTTISSWNKALNAGDLLQFEVVYAINIQRCMVSMKLAL
ncbi:MAG: hypothetical protein CMO44_07390 [Verrucomicrobiales bacterium]|nr:hypothetical protein [Verrucomicrobiales bacterium]